MRIVFFGTPEFAAFSLEKILQAGYEVVAVVTAPDKPAGRGMNLRESEVKKVALKHGLKLFQPEKLKDEIFQNELLSLKPDLGIVIAFRMLPESVWSMPKIGTFNLHASLLPNYRGAAPINHAIIEGEKQTGVSTFFLKHEIDTGDLLLQQAIDIEDDDNAGALHDKLMLKGSDLVLETLKQIAEGTAKPHSQQVTGFEKQAPKLNREFCQLKPVEGVLRNHNKVRGLSPFPGAWIETDFGPLKILMSKPASEVHLDSENVVQVWNRGLYFKCNDGWLQLIKVQPAGKPVMDASAFVNGLSNKK